MKGKVRAMKLDLTNEERDILLRLLNGADLRRFTQESLEKLRVTLRELEVSQEKLDA